MSFARLRPEQDRGRNKEESDREFQEMPLPREDVDATMPKFLRDKYAVVGVVASTSSLGRGIS